MVGCDVSVKRISCRVVKSVPFDAGSDAVAAFVARAADAYKASQAGPSRVGFAAVPEVRAYTMHSGSVRVVSDHRPAGQSLDCFA